jgi:hypothetical protein
MRSFGVRRLYTFNKIRSVDYTEKAAEIVRSLFSKDVRLLKDERPLYNSAFVCILITFLKKSKSN